MVLWAYDLAARLGTWLSWAETRAFKPKLEPSRPKLELKPKAANLNSRDKLEAKARIECRNPSGGCGKFRFKTLKRSTWGGFPT